jgi:beta-lactamase superfamily II metal-dependent hydrolase
MRKSVLTLLFLFLLGVILQAQDLKIHHINVGQGDCTLIVSPTGRTMLIDAGNNGLGTSKVLPYLQGLGVASLDYVVTTHYHADHMGGSDEVINGLTGLHVGTVLDRGTAHAVPTTVTYTTYVPAAASAVGGRQTLTTGQIIDLGGGVTLKCLATDGTVLGTGTIPSATSSENDLSNAWLLSFNEFRYFTGGDCGGETTYYADLETPIAQVVGKVDAFKVNHHGSQYSTNQTFLNALNPTAAVIMVGNGNTYGHPVQAILDRLAAANCYTYLTEAGAGGTVAAGRGVVANGNVVIATTGHTTYTVSYGTQTDSYPLHTVVPSGVAVSLSPATASLATGGTATFTAAVTGTTNTAVTWTCSAGSITAAGLYTAPATAGTATVTATSVADVTKSATATVTITAATPVSVAISPATASLATGGTATFTATVTGTTNTAVTWTCSAGSITAAGLYTAPATAGTATVTATSVADATKSATATVTVTAGTGTTFVEVEPNNTPATANVVGDAVTAITGYFPSASDNDDCFALTLLAGHTLVVDMTGPTASKQDYDLYLYSSGGTQLATSRNTGTTEHLSYKNTNVSTPKTLTLKVHRVASYSSVTPYKLVISR